MLRSFVVLFLSAVFCDYNALAQSFRPDLSSWDAQVLKLAKRKSKHILVPRHSDEVVLYTNLARMNGSLFVSTVLKPYCEFYGFTDDSAYRHSLIKHLNQLEKQEPLKHRIWLSWMAKRHARVSGRKGTVGHRNIERRLWINAQLRGGYGENAAYGIEDPLEVVITLLIDEGVPSLGHRYNITSADFKRIGVAFARHKKYGINCVQEFSQ